MPFLEFGKRHFLIIFFFLVLFYLHGEETEEKEMPELDVLRDAYPESEFEAYYNGDLEDWMIRITADGISSELVWAEGRFIPESRWETRENYRRLLYRFPEGVWDPTGITPEMLERVSQYGSTENRRTAPVLISAFFDALYDSDTKEDVEAHIVSITFLGMDLRVHEKIWGKLENAERKICKAVLVDKAVADFVAELGNAGGYSWRQISDTQGKSFHSMGLAVDLLPADGKGKSIYWLWDKNGGNEKWMLLPLEDRWMPPKSVVDIFEEEGFIWGGKWPIWDNMHFEYRPELIQGRTLFE